MTSRGQAPRRPRFSQWGPYSSPKHFPTSKLIFLARTGKKRAQTAYPARKVRKPLDRAGAAPFEQHRHLILLAGAGSLLAIRLPQQQLNRIPLGTMLMVLADTNSKVNTTTVEIEPIRILMLPHMDTMLIWNARSVSARTSAEVFSKALLMESTTTGISSMLRTLTHQVPT